LLPEPHPIPYRADEASTARTKSRRVILAVVRPKGTLTISATRTRSSMTVAGADETAIIALARRRQLWDQAAFKHLVGDGGRYLVDEGGAQLRVVVQKLYGFLFPLRLWLAPLLPQLLA
jgi:hypothetical protein